MAPWVAVLEMHGNGRTREFCILAGNVHTDIWMAVSGRDAQPSAPTPYIQLSTVQPGKAAVPVGAVGSPVASFSISNDSSVEPLAFCANNAPLAGYENSRRAPECRAYM